MPRPLEAAPRAERGISSALVVAPAPLGTGGLGTAAAEFSVGLAAIGCQSRFVGLQPRGAFARAVAARPVRRAFGSGPLVGATARAVRRAVPDDGWDLAYAMPGTLPLERGSGLRVVHQATRHPARRYEALRLAERQTGGRGGMSRAELRRCEVELRRADLVHVTTEAVREELQEAGLDPQRLVHAYLGVDLDRFRPGPKADRLTIAFVGPLSLGKGVDAVAELAELLGGEAVVEAVGGPSCPWSRRLVERARFVFGTSVAEALAAAHFLVLPSRSDGFSYAVLEALASGTVPLVTPEVGAAEVVRRLDPRLVLEREGFAERAAELLPRLDLAELAPRARALAERFDRRRASRLAAEVVIDRAEQLRGGGGPR
jgi:glycosyltransferase involved in cell wall biosynthesis